MLQYTGGTTGTPKGAMLTHGNIFANVVQTESWTNPAYVLSGDERYLVVIPYFHIYAFTVCMMVGLRVGALQIIHPEVRPRAGARRDPRLPADLLPRRADGVRVAAQPSEASREYGLEQRAPVQQRRRAVPGRGDRGVRAPHRPAAERRLRAVGNLAGHALDAAARRCASSGTIGLPFPDTDMKIVDVETGTRELPVGEAGELCIAGPQVMKGYWNKPEESAQRPAHATPTAASGSTPATSRAMDEDGYTSIVQRKKDMIIVDGFNVYPSEVESVLYTHPAVRLAAVIGVPDAYHGEIVKACIALKPGATATADEIDRALPDQPHRIQGAAHRRDPRHAADERGRQDPLSRAARRARGRGAPRSLTPRRSAPPA